MICVIYCKHFRDIFIQNANSQSVKLTFIELLINVIHTTRYEENGEKFTKLTKKKTIKCL